MSQRCVSSHPILLEVQDICPWGGKSMVLAARELGV